MVMGRLSRLSRARGPLVGALIVAVLAVGLSVGEGSDPREATYPDYHRVGPQPSERLGRDGIVAELSNQIGKRTQAVLPDGTLVVYDIATDPGYAGRRNSLRLVDPHTSTVLATLPSPWATGVRVDVPQVTRVTDDDLWVAWTKTDAVVYQPMSSTMRYSRDTGAWEVYTLPKQGPWTRFGHTDATVLRPGGDGRLYFQTYVDGDYSDENAALWSMDPADPDDIRAVGWTAHRVSPGEAFDTSDRFLAYGTQRRLREWWLHVRDLQTGREYVRRLHSCDDPRIVASDRLVAVSCGFTRTKVGVYSVWGRPLAAIKAGQNDLTSVNDRFVTMDRLRYDTEEGLLVELHDSRVSTTRTVRVRRLVPTPSAFATGGRSHVDVPPRWVLRNTPAAGALPPAPRRSPRCSDGTAVPDRSQCEVPAADPAGMGTVFPDALETGCAYSLSAGGQRNQTSECRQVALSGGGSADYRYVMWDRGYRLSRQFSGERVRSPIPGTIATRFRSDSIIVRYPDRPLGKEQVSWSVEVRAATPAKRRQAMQQLRMLDLKELRALA